VTFAFDARERLIVLEGVVWGPNGRQALRLGLDTGATETVLSVRKLAFLGYGFPLIPEQARLITGSAIEFAPRVVVERIAALGQERSGFPMLAYTLPPEIGVDGLLGLDFLRGLRLTVDFREGQVSLE
jgi:Aspartyl protease